MKPILLLLILSQSFFLMGQEKGKISGKIIDAQTREALPFVDIMVYGTTTGTVSDKNGHFQLDLVPLGYNKIQASFLGYQTFISDDYLVTREKSPIINIVLNKRTNTLGEIEIKGSLFKKSTESPLSLQSLGLAEIEKNPGGNRDVLKVIQSFPGVASNPGFRNDIIVRGGATSEVKFYLDGIEVPVINHFQTQGATGGPVGIINTDLIRKVDFYSSAFPADRGNALSAIIALTQKKGNPTALNTRASLGSSDAGITLDGPLNKHTTFIFSARQSYLQFLFKLIKLPFLPTYNDFQLNVSSQISKNSTLSIIALGAIDRLKINNDVNNNVTDEKTLKRNKAILNAIPVNNQWNYTIGANYQYMASAMTHTLVVSRNELKNTAVKYFLNNEIPDNLLLNYESKETENKLRYENQFSSNTGYNFNLGFNLETATYFNNTFMKDATVNGVSTKNFQTTANFFKYGAFGQVSKKYFNSKLGVSLGFRMDGIDYNTVMKNPFQQFSPRMSLSYQVSKKWRINSTIGRYYQLPSYTVLGYKDNTQKLVNKNGLKYIQSNHLVTGLAYRPSHSSKISIEGFYKTYKNYPFSIKNQISLANLGNDFGVVGNEAVSATSTGRAYGFEVLAQKKSYDGLYGIVSYTFVKSEFKNAEQRYIPSSWDNRHLLTVTAGKKLNHNWEIGTKFRLVGGRPYTPYNTEASSIKQNYDVQNGGLLDYSKLNSERFNTFTQLDFRIDKTWFLNKLAINLYLDIQNIYASSAQQQPFLIPAENSSGRITDPNDNGKYLLEEIESTSGRILPSVGVIIDF